MVDFAKFDNMFDIDALRDDVKASAQGDSDRQYAEVPTGRYEVKIEKLELVETKKTAKPMVTCWMRIISEGQFKNSMIFMNQVVDSGFKIHIANQFVASLLPGGARKVKFESFAQYADMLLDVAEEIDGKYEYGLAYGENSKGFKTYEITDVFEL